MEKKRPRGRPKGTTINDSRYLDAVADYLVRNPKAKKTPTIAKVVAEAFPEHRQVAAKRRILRKWNETDEERLEAARQRRQEEQSSGVSRKVRLEDVYSSTSQIGKVMEQAMKLDNILNSPGLRALRKQQEELERIQNLVDPLGSRHFREQLELVERLSGRIRRK